MSFLFLVLAGVVIGLIAAAPIGPVNLICIRRSLAFGPLNGFVAGLGAAIGDGVFATVTAFGFTAVAHFIEGFSIYLQIGGGVLLISFGIHTYLTLPDHRKPASEREGEAGSLASILVSTFVLTMTNPATLFGFAAMFAGLNGLIGGQISLGQAAVTVGGVVAGSALWWFALTATIGLLHAKINAATMRIINHASGIAIIVFGAAVLVHVGVKVFLKG